MKLLFTTPIISMPAVGGPELRVSNSIKALAKVSELHVFPRCSVNSKTMRFLDATCSGVAHSPASVKYPLIMRAFRKAMSKLFPDTVASIITKLEVQKQTNTIVRYAEAHHVCAVWFSYGCVSYALMRSVKRAAPNLRLICSTYDVIVRPPTHHKRPNLVMMGSYYARESPMVRSARWVIAHVMPRVREVIPQTHLYIVGNGSDKFLKDLESDAITVTGRVESTLPYLKHADVALAPLLFEAAGTKYKVLEAAICEIPIVATPVGAEGLPTGYHKYLRVCTGAEEFASGILETIEKDASAMERLNEFKRYIARDFGLEQLSAEGAAILRHIYAK